jgi:hypothetical protein
VSAEVGVEDVRMVVEACTQDVLTDRQYGIAQSQVWWRWTYHIPCQDPHAASPLGALRFPRPDFSDTDE